MKKRSKNSKLRIFSGRDARWCLLPSRGKRSPEKPPSSADDRFSPDHAPVLPGEIAAGAFPEEALGRLAQMPSFAAMVIRPDQEASPGASDRDGGTVEKMRRLTQAIDQACQPHGGVWGRLGGDSCGCILPGMGDAACMELAHGIQERMLQEQQQTVSIGVAVFPMIDFERGDIMENAGKALAHAAFLGPNSVVLCDAVSLNISGDALYQKGDVAGAVKEFQRALKLDADNINVLNSLGVCYGMQGELEEALRSFESVIALDAGHVMAHYNAGYICTLLKRDEHALECYLRADAIDEEVFEVAFQIGKLYFKMGDFTNGKRFFQKALAVKPDSAPTHFHLGESLEALGETDAALAQYKTAVKKNPNDAAALSALGVLYDARGENPEIAMLFCEKSVEISPENGLFRYRLGTVYAHNNQLEKALEAFENAVRLGYDAAFGLAEVNGRLAEDHRRRLSN